MARLKNPESEARRVAAVRAALYRERLWERGAAYGRVSAAGLRRRGQNPIKTGSESIAFKLAVRYCEAVIAALAFFSNATQAETKVSKNTIFVKVTRFNDKDPVGEKGVYVKRAGADRATQSPGQPKVRSPRS